MFISKTLQDRCIWYSTEILAKVYAVSGVLCDYNIRTLNIPAVCGGAAILTQ